MNVKTMMRNCLFTTCLGILIFQVTALSLCDRNGCLETSNYPEWSSDHRHVCHLSSTNRIEMQFMFQKELVRQDKNICPPRLLFSFASGVSYYLCARSGNNSLRVIEPFHMEDNDTMQITLFNPARVKIKLMLNVTTNQDAASHTMSCQKESSTVTEVSKSCPCTDPNEFLMRMVHTEDWGKRVLVGFVSAFVFLVIVGISIGAKYLYERKFKKQKPQLPKPSLGDINFAYSESRSTLDTVDSSKYSSVPFTPDPNLKLELQTQAVTPQTEWPTNTFESGDSKLRMSTDSGLYSEVADTQPENISIRHDPSAYTDNGDPYSYTTEPNTDNGDPYSYIPEPKELKFEDSHVYASVDEVNDPERRTNRTPPVPPNMAALPPIPPLQTKRLTEEEIEALYSKPNKVRTLPRENSGPIGSSTPARGSKAGSFENLAIHPSFIVLNDSMTSLENRSLETDL